MAGTVVSLTTIVAAFVAVAVVFNGAGVLAARLDKRRQRSAMRDPAGAPSGPQTRTAGRGLPSRVWPGATFEALVLTLVAALWFGSLGHGGWVILFLLLGSLPAGDRWLRRALAGAPPEGEAWLFVASLLKYLLAGWACVWLLS
jgi:hypothetical protein